MVFPGDLPPSVWGMIWCQGYRDYTQAGQRGLFLEEGLVCTQ